MTSQSTYLHAPRLAESVAYLEQRLALLANEGRGLPLELLRDDLEALLLEVAAQLSALIDVGDLDRRLGTALSVDFLSIERALALLEEAGLRTLSLGRREVDPRVELSELRDFLRVTREQSPRMEPLELYLRLELFVDGKIFDLLMAAAEDDKNLNSLLELVLLKLKNVSDPEIAELWARTMQEFRQRQDPSLVPFPKESARLPEGFFQFHTSDAARAKLARYAVEYRPRIVLDHVRAGHARFPVGSLGLGTILAAKEQPGDRLSGTEQAIARSLARLAAYLELMSRRKAAELATVLGAAPKGAIFAGAEYQKAKLACGKERKRPERLMRFELRNLLLSVRSVAAEPTPLLAILKRFKLGLEFTSPDCSETLRNQDEKALQRSLRKYLIDHGIYSFGTDFGRGQADAFVEEHPGSYVIEVKRFHRGGATGAKIRAALVQLQNYMDLVAGPRQGVLVLYCFVEPAIIEPREWIQGRYYILPINLLRDVPSRQSSSLSISSSGEDDLIVVQRV